MKYIRTITLYDICVEKIDIEPFIEVINITTDLKDKWLPSYNIEKYNYDNYKFQYKLSIYDEDEDSIEYGYHFYYSPNEIINFVLMINKGYNNVFAKSYNLPISEIDKIGICEILNTIQERKK